MWIFSQRYSFSLLSIFQKHLHDLPNIRLQRFREHLVDYNFDVRWCPGKEHLIADALSRAPVFPASPDTSTAQICSFSVEDTCDIISRDPAFAPILVESSADPEYQLLIKSTLADLPLSASLSPYNHVRHLLSIYTDIDSTCSLVIYDGSRLVIPTKSRRSILVSLYASHSGEVKSYSNARQLYYWPGMKNDITQFVRSCQACQRLLPSQQSEPLLPLVASFPMEQVSVDSVSYTHLTLPTIYSV